MDLTEKYARHICESRGADPDQPITVGQPDGTSEFHEVAWKGYAKLAGELLAMHGKEPSK